MDGADGVLAIQDFYLESLPQLGWVAGEGQFVRDGEVLRFEIDGELVRMMVSPD